MADIRKIFYPESIAVVGATENLFKWGSYIFTNIIAGGMKNCLAGTQWAFSHVTVPSVIIGQNYQIAYARGLEYVAATFEHNDENSLMLEDRLLQVAISLIRL